MSRTLKSIKGYQRRRKTRRIKREKSKSLKGGQTAELTVSYGDKNEKKIITSDGGVILTKSETASQPEINVKGRGLMLLVMSDPDAPNGEGSTGNRTFIHMVEQFDGSGGNNSISVKKRVIVPYMGPSPPRGVHRYIFDLYSINGEVKLPDGKPGFEYSANISSAAKSLQLLKTVYFRVAAR
jgi:hypothetical protein